MTKEVTGPDLRQQFSRDWRPPRLRQVQKQLGHAKPATTANMYADVSFEDMQAGVTGVYGTEKGHGGGWTPYWAPC